MQNLRTVENGISGMESGARDGLLLGALGTVLRSCLLASIDTEAVEGATNDVISNARQISNSSTAHEDDGVLLKVMTFAADVRRDFATVGESHSSDLPERRVGLLGSHGADLEADSASLGRHAEVAHLRLGNLYSAWLADKLVNRRHNEAIPDLQDGVLTWRYVPPTARRAA